MTECVETALRELYASSGGPEAGWPWPAVGSLARRELGPRSDIDLVLLHDGRNRAPHQRTGRAVVVSAVGRAGPDGPFGADARRVRRGRRAGAERRGRVVGSAARSAATATWWRRPGAPCSAPGGTTPASGSPNCSASLEERHATAGDAAYLLEPDLKEARGGLRDMIMLRALAATWLTDRPHTGVNDPYERMLDVRDALHVTSGRTLDRLLVAEVDDVAQLLGHRDRRPAAGDQSRGAPHRSCGRHHLPRGSAGDRPPATRAVLRPAGTPAGLRTGAARPDHPPGRGGSGPAGPARRAAAGAARRSSRRPARPRALPRHRRQPRRPRTAHSDAVAGGSARGAVRPVVDRTGPPAGLGVTRPRRLHRAVDPGLGPDQRPAAAQSDPPAHGRPAFGAVRRRGGKGPDPGRATRPACCWPACCTTSARCPAPA